MGKNVPNMLLIKNKACCRTVCKKDLIFINENIHVDQKKKFSLLHYLCFKGLFYISHLLDQSSSPTPVIWGHFH